jgi:hypothetical protein
MLLNKTYLFQVYYVYSTLYMCMYYGIHVYSGDVNFVEGKSEAGNGGPFPFQYNCMAKPRYFLNFCKNHTKASYLAPTPLSAVRWTIT